MKPAPFLPSASRLNSVSAAGSLAPLLESTPLLMKQSGIAPPRDSYINKITYLLRERRKRRKFIRILSISSTLLILITFIYIKSSNNNNNDNNNGRPLYSNIPSPSYEYIRPSRQNIPPSSYQNIRPSYQDIASYHENSPYDGAIIKRSNNLIDNNHAVLLSQHLIMRRSLLQSNHRNFNTTPNMDSSDTILPPSSGDTLALSRFKRASTESNVPVPPLEEGQVAPSNRSISLEDKKFPNDLFTRAQRKSGFITFHIFGLIYMFVALAIVCDEFFIPSLDVITEKLQISEDVAGATFMAAGGSAPELFTSIIGVFISQDDVGIGTIVGSAVFNILFVISMCAIFSKTVLELTWWPLFRDVSFYSVILITLMYCFYDSKIYWYESLILLSWYFGYVSFMKYNETIEGLVKRTFSRLMKRNKVDTVQPVEGATNAQGGGVTGSQRPNGIDTIGPVPGTASGRRLSHMSGGRRQSVPLLHGGSSKLRQGVLQLMIHSIDPMHSHHGGTIDPETGLVIVRNRRRSSGGQQSNHRSSMGGESSRPGTMTSKRGKNQEGKEEDDDEDKKMEDREDGENDAANDAGKKGKKKDAEDEDDDERKGGGRNVDDDPAIIPGMISNGSIGGATSTTIRGERNNNPKEEGATRTVRMPQFSADSGDGVKVRKNEEDGEEEEKEEEEPLDVSWPDLWYKKITYVILFPIIIPLWLTLPDVRRPEKRKFFAGSFIGSIVWIAFFSYLMVWWATLVGENFDIPPEIMGLTLLSAGTSIPDLITSVLVARKGLGDMAVSSSVGSNIFDVTIGLPLPWFLYGTIFGVVQVNSQGMACSIMILFAMLMFVIITIAAFNWKLNIGMAIVMFLLYIVFMIVSLMFEKEVIICSSKFFFGI